MNIIKKLFTTSSERDFKRTTTYKNLSISDICHCMYPCIHFVILPDGTKKSMNGYEIYKIIHKRHPAYKHFRDYKDFDPEKRRIEFEQQRIENDKKMAELGEKRRLEDELSNYNKQNNQPEFIMRSYI